MVLRSVDHTAFQSFSLSGHSAFPVVRANRPGLPRSVTIYLTFATSQPVFLNVYGAQELTQRIKFRRPMCLCSLAGRYDNPIPTRFLAPVYCLKILSKAQGVKGIFG
jgi:hypothetical protein